MLGRSDVESAQIRILCVDDHPLMLDGITRKIELQSDMVVAATATTGEDAVTLFRQHRPDITLMDLRLPRLSGLDAIRMIRSEDPGAKIIVLTVYQGDEDIYRALKAGAAGYVLKHTASDELIQVVRDVHGGAHPIPADSAVQIVARLNQPRLTTREVTVLELVGQGLRNKEIGARLGISEDTAEVHIRNIFAKLEVNDRTAAVMVGLRRGIIHIS
jgi:DNA-binding NarL/FixJ family response regulator